MKRQEKNREQAQDRQAVLYVFWGFTTTFLNLTLYLLLQHVMNYKAANAVSIVSAKIYAYFVNAGDGGICIVPRIYRNH